MDDIKNNLESLRLKIKSVATLYHRDADKILLLAVSKKKSAECILRAYQSGQRDFAENYVQEFLEKYQACHHLDIRWHFIGRLQTNKVKEIVGKVHLIHSLDNFKLAQSIEKWCEKRSYIQNCLIQVNISRESQKTGCEPADLPDFLSAMNALKHIKILGLMMVGSRTDDKILVGQEFANLRKLQDEINSRQIYQNHLSELSMGMSSHFDLAVQKGSTCLRIGTQIFGRRE